MKLLKKLSLVSLALLFTMGVTSCGSNNDTAGNGDNTGGDNTGGNTGGDNTGGNTGGDNTGGNTGGDNTGGNTGGDNTGTVDKKYTYNYAMSVFPTNWNYHTYQTETDTDIMDYTSAGFYEFDYNDTKDGYSIIPAMAEDLPVDITSEYVGQYGIEEGNKGRAYKIALRDDLKWEDGSSITAADFVASAKLLLDPIAQNFRADSLYSGNMVVANAENYLKQGKHVYNEDFLEFDADGNPASDFVALSDLEKDKDGVYYTDLEGGHDLGINLNAVATYLGYSLSDLYTNYLGNKIEELNVAYKGLSDAADAAGNVKLNDTTIGHLKVVYSYVLGLFGLKYEKELQWQEIAVVGNDMPATSFDEVGVQTDKDGNLILILEKELTGFYLLYNLSSSWLVNEELYNKCASVKDGIYNNTYGTSAETYMSYGPYKLTSFQADKQYKFEKNEYYFGLTDDTFQTTHIQCDYVKEASTRLQMFLAGKLDSYGLQASDMETYQASDHTYYTDGPSTFYMAINPKQDTIDAFEAANPGKDKEILTLVDFRKAIAFAVDRTAFALAVDPCNNAALSLYSNLIIYNPETGAAYRQTEEAKDVVLAFWGLTDEVGPGKTYPTKDAAIDSITGYDLAGAKKLFQAAYDEAIEKGLMTATDIVEIKIGVPNSTSEFYSKGNDFLVNSFTEAVKGTSLEGKLTFTLDDTLGNGFGDALRDGKVDLLFGVGWNGSALDPYGLITAYTDPAYKYDSALDAKDTIVDIEIDGKTLRLSLYDWTMNVLDGTAVEAGVVVDGKVDPEAEKVSISAGTTADTEVRVKILAACEGAVLQLYTSIPLIANSTAALKGMQITYYTEEYIYGVGRGGVKYMTYTRDDAQWDAYVKSVGGEVNYK